MLAGALYVVLDAGLAIDTVGGAFDADDPFDTATLVNVAVVVTDSTRLDTASPT
jgi:hypothetical protein